jgi:CBS domain-containing protein
MNEHDVGSLVVLRDEELLGIVTYHDLLEELARRGHQLGSRTAADIMTRGVHTATEEDEIEDVQSLMIREHIRHLPVVRGKDVVGVITLIDVLRLHLLRQEGFSQDLISYIGGAYAC